MASISVITPPLKIHTALPGKTRIGWVGTGTMGKWMCTLLIEGGFNITVFNRTAEKCLPLVEKGAKVADSLKSLANESEVIFLMLRNTSDVSDVMLGSEGLIENCQRGAIIVDMTSSSPSLARNLAEIGNKRGVLVLDAPVMGGEVGAREGRLSIMIGGSEAAATALMPCFQIIGRNTQLMGGPGSGQNAKMANQIVIAGSMIGMCEALMYGYKTQLPLDSLIAVIATGAGSSWCVNNFAPKILKKNFDHGLTVDHFLKDLGLALREAESLGISLPGLGLAQQLYLGLKAQGKAGLGMQSLYLVLESLNGQR